MDHFLWTNDRIPANMTIMNNKKTFKYDVLIQEGDICDRIKEIKELTDRAMKRKRTVLFAPRRYGKTSLVKNVVGNHFKKAAPDNVMIYADLMDVKTFQSIAERLQYGISKALSEHFSVKTLLKNIAGLIKKLSVSIDVDSTSGQPSVNFSIKDIETKKGTWQLMEAIKELSEKYNLMLILDEFHDIAFVDEAEAVFRGFLQEFDNVSVFILGSKRHLLKLMFESVNAPLFNFGDELHLSPISAEDWLPYFCDRLSPVNARIEKTEIMWITDQMCDVPNAICELGAWLVENCPDTDLTMQTIKEQLNIMIDSKQCYHYMLQGYTENEKNVLRKIAMNKFILEPQSTSFLSSLSVSKSSVGKIFAKLMDIGTIEHEADKGYRISDPILGHYLATH